MGYARLALYLIGLIVVVAAAWIFLTETPVGEAVPPGVAFAIILLLVGIGIMAGARSMDDTFYTRRRVVRDGDYTDRPGYVAPPTTTVVNPPGAYTPPTTYDTTRETVVEERRY